MNDRDREDFLKFSRQIGDDAVRALRDAILSIEIDTSAVGDQHRSGYRAGWFQCMRAVREATTAHLLGTRRDDRETVIGPDELPVVATSFPGRSTEECGANAAAIALALNNQRALVEALLRILPLAKGYAPEGQTAAARRTCDRWINAAEDVLAAVERG